MELRRYCLISDDQLCWKSTTTQHSCDDCRSLKTGNVLEVEHARVSNCEADRAQSSRCGSAPRPDSRDRAMESTESEMSAKVNPSKIKEGDHDQDSAAGTRDLVRPRGQSR